MMNSSDKVYSSIKTLPFKPMNPTSMNTKFKALE